MEAREDGGLQFFQKLHGFLIKHFKTLDKTKGETLVSEQDFFVDAKQYFNNKTFINGMKEHQAKTENFVPHPKNQ